jgi:hypothetical protein
VLPQRQPKPQPGQPKQQDQNHKKIELEALEFQRNYEMIQQEIKQQKQEILE